MVRNEDGTPTVWKPGSNFQLPLQSGGGGGLPEAMRVSDAWDESWRSIEACHPCSLTSTWWHVLCAQRWWPIWQA